MSTQGYGVDISVIAAADLSAKQFHFVKIDSAGKVAIAGLGERVIGILQNKPGLDQAATVRISGKSKLVADAAVAAGALLKSSVDGQGTTATAATVNTSDAGAAADPVIGSHVAGVALSAAAAAGEVMDALVQPSGIAPTTAA